MSGQSLWAASAEVGYNGLFGEASVKVSTSADEERTDLFRISGASQVGSKVYSALGVKRIRYPVVHFLLFFNFCSLFYLTFLCGFDVLDTIFLHYNPAPFTNI